MNARELALTGAHGVRLAAIREGANPEAIVVFAHGFLSDKHALGRFDRLAARYVEAATPRSGSTSPAAAPAATRRSPTSGGSATCAPCSTRWRPGVTGASPCTATARAGPSPFAPPTRGCRRWS
ncbi:hypothetical protein ACFQX6_18820 [Streptosporangium lutulentum]